jgi:hypothetical protein
MRRDRGGFRYQCKDVVMSAVETALRPLFWNKPLTYEIKPKSGPLGKLVTLADVRTGMVYDLPRGSTRQPHWLQAGLLLVAASESGSATDIRRATEALIDALEIEGWLSAPDRVL